MPSADEERVLMQLLLYQDLNIDALTEYEAKRVLKLVQKSVDIPLSAHYCRTCQAPLNEEPTT